MTIIFTLLSWLVFSPDFARAGDLPYYPLLRGSQAHVVALLSKAECVSLLENVLYGDSIAAGIETLGKLSAPPAAESCLGQVEDFISSQGAGGPAYPTMVQVSEPAAYSTYARAVYWAEKMERCFPGGDVGKAIAADDCSSMKVTQAEWEEAHQELPALRQKVADELAKFTRSLADRYAEIYAKSRGAAENNALQRLLPRYEAFRKKGGSPTQLEKFCAEHEATTRNDARFYWSFFPKNLLVSGYGTSALANQDLKLIRGTGFSEGELFGVRSYTGYFYDRLNRQIRRHELDDGERAYVGVLNSALQRLPAYTGPVLRFADLPPAVLAEHQVGKTVCYEAFTSTSKRSNWTFSGPHKFLIQSSRGRLIQSLSTAPSEEEVLFPPGSCFKVLARQEKAGGKINFVMKELAGGHTPAADLH